MSGVDHDRPLQECMRRFDFLERQRDALWKGIQAAQKAADEKSTRIEQNVLALLEHVGDLRSEVAADRGEVKAALAQLSGDSRVATAEDRGEIRSLWVKVGSIAAVVTIVSQGLIALVVRHFSGKASG
jgi:hypothetical protein